MAIASSADPSPPLDYSHSIMNGLSDDVDNRSRNAKAQRRHREKRKAHLKALEESVTMLTAQLDDARRQIAGGQPYRGGLGGPMSPSTEKYSQLQAENIYLREENADLRRQLYAYRVNYGHMAPPPGAEGSDKGWGEVKPGESGFGVPYGPGDLSSPRQEGRGASNTGSGAGSTSGGGGNGGGSSRQEYMGVNNGHHHHSGSGGQPASGAAPAHHYGHAYGMPSTAQHTWS